MSRFVSFVFLLLGLAMRVPAAELDLPGVDDRWQRYESAHFELYAHGSERTARDTLQHLELLRAVFLERMKLGERTPLPMTVYLFGSRREFNAYGPKTTKNQAALAGFYFARPDRAIICLAPQESDEMGQRVIFHEFVHHMFKVVDDDPPVWFNEGMAEVLAGVRVVGKDLEIGPPVAERLISLRQSALLPLGTLFEVERHSAIYRSQDHAGIFYAQSWALLHYLFFGDNGFPPEAVARFLLVAGNRRAVQTVDFAAHFRTCFGIDYAEMQKRLERYVFSGSYKTGRFPKPATDDPTSFRKSAVPLTEIDLRLAELAAGGEGGALSRLKLVQDHSARALEALGGLAVSASQREQGAEFWDEAITAGSTNIAIYRELAHMESRRWLESFELDFRLTPTAADRLRSRLLRCIELAPEQNAAYELLAWVEAYAPEPSIPNLNQVQKQFQRLRQKDRTLAALAYVRLRNGQNAEALDLLRSMPQFQPDDWTSEAVQLMRLRLTPPDPAAAPKSAKAKSKDLPPPAPATRSPVKVPSVELPERN